MGNKKRVVEYSLDYVHFVQVGITASSDEAACAKVSRMFDAGTLFDDTKDVPILLDDFEEVENGRVLEFVVVAQPKDGFPKPSYMVRRNREELALRELVGNLRKLCARAKAGKTQLMGFMTVAEIEACFNKVARKHRVGKDSILSTPKAKRGCKVAA